MKRTPGYLVVESSIQWNPMETAGAKGRSWIKVFARDPHTGATAALVKYEQGYTAPAFETQVYSDTLYLSGRAGDGDRTYGRRTYAYFPPGHPAGPLTAEEETVKLIITGGRGEECQMDPVFHQDVHQATLDTTEESHMGSDWSKMALRVDKAADCTVVYQICHRSGTFNPGETWVHPHYEEAYYVEADGPTYDYLGEIGGHVCYDSPCYLFRPPGSRHGNAQYSPSIILCKYYSGDPDLLFDLRHRVMDIPTGYLVN